RQRAGSFRVVVQQDDTAVFHAVERAVDNEIRRLGGIEVAGGGRVADDNVAERVYVRQDRCIITHAGRTQQAEVLPGDPIEDDVGVVDFAMPVSRGEAV